MRPIDPTVSLEAAPLAAAPSRGLTSRTPAASPGCPCGGAALTCSDAAILGREAQLLQHRGHTRNTWAVLLACQQKKCPSQSHIKLVELRGLEPLTFSLRRHGVDLIRREHVVIDVQVAAARAPWLHRGGTHGTHGLGSAPRAIETHAVPLARRCRSRPPGCVGTVLIDRRFQGGSAKPRRLIAR